MKVRDARSIEEITAQQEISDFPSVDQSLVNQSPKRLVTQVASQIASKKSSDAVGSGNQNFIIECHIYTEDENESGTSVYEHEVEVVRLSYGSKMPESVNTQEARTPIGVG